MHRPTRTLQIHVTRKCNLKCLHCYSHSGPEETDALDLDALKAVVDDATELGYTLITLSGGEPFLYPQTPELIAYAKAKGVTTAVVTNGMFLDKRRLDALSPNLDLIAISLDGAPERHNMMRANPNAFDVMERKLPALRESGISFGFLFTLSADNAHELDWAVDFALSHGAAMLQIHPLDIAGRAAESADIAGMAPEIDVAMEATKRASAAQTRIGDAMRIIVDFQPRLPDHLKPKMTSCGRQPTFADKVYPLCVETDGSIVPIGHGFAQSYRLGHISEDRGLTEMAEEWTRTGQADRYANLVARVRAAADQPTAPVLQNLAHAFRHASRTESETELAAAS